MGGVGFVIKYYKKLTKKTAKKTNKHICSIWHKKELIINVIAYIFKLWKD